MKDIYEFRQKAAMRIMEHYPELDRHDMDNQLMLLDDIPVKIKETAQLAPDVYTGIFSIPDKDGLSDIWHVTFTEPGEWDMLNLTTGDCYIDTVQEPQRPVIYLKYSSMANITVRT